jgi:hypothetical protein
MAVGGSIRASTSVTGRASAPSRPLLVWALVVPMAFLSIGGFFGGLSFIADRTGRALGADASWLERTPVGDFLLPGLFLFGIFGVGVAVLIGGLITRRPDRNLWSHHWSWLGTIGMGAVLVSWIGYELLVFDDRMILQPILIAVGLAVIGIPLLPSMRRSYAARRFAGASTSPAQKKEEER